MKDVVQNKTLFPAALQWLELACPRHSCAVCVEHFLIENRCPGNLDRASLQRRWG